MDQKQWSQHIERAVHSKGRPLLESMQILYDNKLISDVELKAVEIEKRRSMHALA